MRKKSTWKEESKEGSCLNKQTIHKAPKLDILLLQYRLLTESGIWSIKSRHDDLKSPLRSFLYYKPFQM